MITVNDVVFAAIAATSFALQRRSVWSEPYERTKGYDRMEYLIDSAEMKRCDHATIVKIRIPSLVLVERAALCAAEELYNGTFNLERVLVVCGVGNNGADGFALARLLHIKGIDISVLFIGDCQAPKK